MNVSLVITKGNCGAVDTENYSCHGYYIIVFSSSLYILRAGLNIDGQVISSGEIVCEGNYFFQLTSIIVIVFLPDHFL